eukprot:jgi/Galph1/4771/GphlegSOOS_G3470.1
MFGQGPHLPNPLSASGVSHSFPSGQGVPVPASYPYVPGYQGYYPSAPLGANSNVQGPSQYQLPMYAVHSNVTGAPENVVSGGGNYSHRTPVISSIPNPSQYAHHLSFESNQGTTGTQENDRNSTLAQNAKKIKELAEMLSKECENFSVEVDSSKNINEELRRKVEAQVVELSVMERALMDLERKHTQMKQQYEEEILRLRAQLNQIQQHNNSPQLAAIGSNLTMKTQTNSSNNNVDMSNNANIAHSHEHANKPSFPTNFSGGNSNAVSGGLSVQNTSASLSFKTQNIPVQNGTGTPAQGPSLGLTSEAVETLKSFRQEQFDEPNANFPAISSSSAANTQAIPSFKETSFPEGASGVNIASKTTEKHSETGSTSHGATTEETDFIVHPGHLSSRNVNIRRCQSYSLDSVVCCVRYSMDGRYLATGSNRTSDLFDALTGEHIAKFSLSSTEKPKGSDSFSSEPSYIRAVAFSTDGTLLCTGGEDHSVRIWDIKRRAVRFILNGHTGHVYSVDACNDGRILASGSGDQTVKLWNIQNGQEEQTLNCGSADKSDGITSVSFSPRGPYRIATGSLEKSVRVFDVETGQVLHTFQQHADSVYSVAFSMDGRYLLSGSLDKTVMLWDLSAPRPNNVTTFKGHTDFVLSVTFSLDGRLLLSGSKDRTVNFWDPRVPSGSIAVLEGHKNSVISVSHCPISDKFATGSGDCHAKIWKYNVQKAQEG